jgi:hypothetical protein
LLAGERVTFRRGRQTASKPMLLNPMVFLGVVVSLFARAFVFPTSFPSAIASLAVVVLTTRAAAPWSVRQRNLLGDYTTPKSAGADLVDSNGVEKIGP